MDSLENKRRYEAAGPQPLQQEDRRSNARIPIPESFSLRATVWCGMKMVKVGQVVNVSRQGVLIELADCAPSQFRIHEVVSVKLQLRHDVVWLAGVIRHRYGRRAGIWFSTQKASCSTSRNESALTRLLQALQWESAKV